jgi:hypothetical protein
MSLANQSEKRERLSAGRPRSNHSFRPIHQADSATSSRTEQHGAKEDRMSFAEDFMLEHTHASLRIAFIGVAGDSASSSREQYKSAQCYGFPS